MDRLRASLQNSVVALVVVVLVGGCAAAEESGSAVASAEAPSASETPPITGAPSASASPSESEAPAAEATTLRTLIAAAPESPTLIVAEELAGDDGHTSAVVSYESGGFTIFGVLHTPEGEGPLPGIVFVHGAVDPDTWSAETEFVAEQHRMVSAGYAVLVPDLRNHGDSDDDPDYGVAVEMGTTVDVINAARALAAEPAVDPARIAVVGHSLGAGITMNVAVVAPDVASAFVALAPVHPSPWENVAHFGPTDSPFYIELTELRGTPDDNPEFWADVSALSFVERADKPLLVVHGSADDVVAPGWADVIGTAWADAGKDVEVVTIEGGDHEFAPVQDEAWAAVFSFLEEHLPGA